MTEPTDDLQQRCAEIVEWQRTGVLPGNALRDYAAAHLAGRHDSLQMAERDTSAQAMQWIAKWATPPAGVGKPVAWLSTDSIGERYLCFTKPNDSDPARPLVFGDTTPQPTQAQAGAVPLTDREIELIEGMIQIQLDHASRCDAIANRAMADKQKGWDMERVALLQKLKVHGIKGGQHGAE